MAIEINGRLRADLAKALFNCVTVLSFGTEMAEPRAIQAQIDECNDVLRRLGYPDMAAIPARRTG